MSLAADLQALAPQTPADLAALFPPGRVPTELTLIPAGCAPPRRFASTFDLAMALAQLLDGRELVLSRSMATYPGFATFPAFSVHAAERIGSAAGATAEAQKNATWLCSVAVQDLTAEALDARVAEAQARLRLRPTGAAA